MNRNKSHISSNHLRQDNCSWWHRTKDDLYVILSLQRTYSAIDELNLSWATNYSKALFQFEEIRRIKYKIYRSALSAPMRFQVLELSQSNVDIQCRMTQIKTWRTSRESLSKLISLYKSRSGEERFLLCRPTWQWQLQIMATQSQVLV